MRVLIEPPWQDWRLGPGPGSPAPGSPGATGGRDELAACCARPPRGVAPVPPAAGGEGATRPPLGASTRIVATGHQAWLWHPGVLAKYIAAAEAARRLGAVPLAVVVDHDVHDALRLELPVRQSDRLSVVRGDLAPSVANVPAGAQRPADPEDVLHTLRSLRDASTAGAAGVQTLIDAWTGLPASSSLADQVALVLARLMRPYVGAMAMVHASDLMELAPAQALLARMLAEARRCAQAYNQAVAQHPHAGIEPLSISPELVELPLWRWTAGSPRRRVYADLTSSVSIFVTADGQAIDPGALKPDEHLAPRALLLTGLMRWAFCDLFIHGRGGAIYDQVTQQWWRLWTSAPLAPDTVVSADLFLPLDAPVAGADELAHAQWWAHHLPHNIDRVAADLAGEPQDWARRKGTLLAHMEDDRDRVRRAGSFAQLHELNRALAQARPQLLAQAQQQLDRARVGLANRALAARRDWCFALYPPAQLAELAAAIRA